MMILGICSLAYSYRYEVRENVGTSAGKMSYNIVQVVIYLGGCMNYNCDLWVDVFSSIALCTSKFGLVCAAGFFDKNMFLMSVSFCSTMLLLRLHIVLASCTMLLQ